MNARTCLITAAAALITAAQLAGLNALMVAAHRPPQRAMAAADADIPMLPTIRVRPTREEVRAAFAGTDVASNAPPDYVMPFYSFAVKPAAANKG
jgi:hypothetical protein